MNIGILGTGMVGRTLAARLVELGNSVSMGTRDVAKTLTQSEPDRMGNLPINAWLKQNPGVSLVPFNEAASKGELLFNATNGAASIAVLRMAGENNLNGKTLADVANPLDFSRGMPPSLWVSNTDSLAEQIQKAFPLVKVVKTLNTMNANLMINPRQLKEGNHSVFMSGNDSGAKAQVSQILKSFGWQDIIDLGDITSARGVEMYLPLWLRLSGAAGTPIVNIQVVR